MYVLILLCSLLEAIALRWVVVAHSVFSKVLVLEITVKPVLSGHSKKTK